MVSHSGEESNGNHWGIRESFPQNNGGRARKGRSSHMFRDRGHPGILTNVRWQPQAQGETNKSPKFLRCKHSLKSLHSSTYVTWSAHRVVQYTTGIWVFPHVPTLAAASSHTTGCAWLISTFPFLPGPHPHSSVQVSAPLRNLSWQLITPSLVTGTPLSTQTFRKVVLCIWLQTERQQIARLWWPQVNNSRHFQRARHVFKIWQNGSSIQQMLGTTMALVKKVV